MLRQKSETFTDAPLLHISEALDNANSLRGNEYRVEGKVESRWVRDTGEGLSLKVEEDGRTEYFFIMIPVIFGIIIGFLLLDERDDHLAEFGL